MLLQLVAAAIKGLTPVVTLSGGTFSHTVTEPTNAESGIRLKATGGIQEQDGGSFAGRSTATDWIIPNSAAHIDFDCRVTSVTGTFTTLAAAVDTWIDCGSDRTWSVLRNSVGTTTVSFTFEIRNRDGVTVATAAYSVEAIVDSP